MEITLYSKNNCMQCKMTKRFLAEHQIPFNEINIDDQPEAVENLKAAGFRSVPVLTTTDSSIVGFRPEELRQLVS